MQSRYTNCKLSLLLICCVERLEEGEGEEFDEEGETVRLVMRAWPRVGSRMVMTSRRKDKTRLDRLEILSDMLLDPGTWRTWFV